MDSITDKQCCNCGEVKDKSEFPIAKNRKDGRGTWCKACMRVYSQEHYKNNKEKYSERYRKAFALDPERLRARAREWIRGWRKNNPEKSKERDKKYRETHRDDTRAAVRKYRAANTEKLREKDRKHHAANRSKYRELLRKWFSKNPEKIKEYNRTRRAREKGNGGRITAGEWRKLCEKYGNKCLYLGCNRTDITMDHVVPLAMGGSHTIDNVQPLCTHHNISKRTKTIDYRY